MRGQTLSTKVMEPYTQSLTLKKGTNAVEKVNKI